MTRRINAWHSRIRYACSVCGHSYGCAVDAVHCEGNHALLGEMYPSERKSGENSISFPWKRRWKAPSAEPSLEDRVATLEAELVSARNAIIVLVSAAGGTIRVERKHLEDAPFMTLVREYDFTDDDIIYRVMTKR